MSAERLTDAQRAYEHNVARFGEHLHSIGIGPVAPCRTDGCRLSWDHPGDCAVAPVRVQLSRTRGWRKPANTVVVARPSRWGNPWSIVKVRDGWAASWQWGATGLGEPWHPSDEYRYIPCLTRVDAHGVAVALYAWYIDRRPQLNAADLRGRNLACWCPQQYSCHADVLLQIANAAVTR